MLKRHPVLIFYLVVLGLTLFGAWLAYSVFPGSLWVRWVAAFSPALAAVVLTGQLDGKAGVALLLARLLRWKVNWKWYLAIFLLPVLFSQVWAFLNALVDGLGFPAAWDNLSRLLQALLSGGPGLLLLTPLMALLIAGEELGWRGFALERLLKTRGPVVASLIVGFFWGIWHLPEVLDPTSVLNKAPLSYSIPLFVLGTVVFSFIYTWLWQNSRGSLLVMCLFHSFYDLLNYFTAAVFPSFYVRFWLYLLVIGLILLPVWAISGRAKNRRLIHFKAIILLFLVALLAACNVSTPQPTQTPVPTATVLPSSTPTPRPSATPTPVPTLLPTPTPERPIPISMSTMTAEPTFPDSFTRTTVVMDNGLTWTECALPDRAFTYDRGDMRQLSKCAAMPVLNAEDKSRMGERVEIQSGRSDFRIILGNDLFETRVDIHSGCCQYDLLKNGKVVLHAGPSSTAYDPNISLWNLEGKYVWELSGWWSGIFVDGVDLNQKYQLEGSYYSYEIKGKLIYVAKKNGQYHIMYDDKVTGPEFDEISMPHCCGGLPLLYGSGQYWFAGRRGGTNYLVSIH